LKDGHPNVFCKVWCDGRGEKGGATDPVQDELNMHANVRCHLAIPVMGGLELVEAEFQGIFVVGAGRNVSAISDCFDKKESTHAS
jgi:hypothetical protein